MKKNLVIAVSIVFICCFLLYMLIGVFVWSRDVIWIRNYTVKSVLTGSMNPQIPRGSLIVLNQIDPSELQLSDDIAFFVAENIIFTHRIIGIYENYEGTGLLGFRTMGIANDEPDREIVLEANVVGRVVNVIPWVGNIIR